VEKKGIDAYRVRGGKKPRERVPSTLGDHADQTRQLIQEKREAQWEESQKKSTVLHEILKKKRERRQGTLQERKGKDKHLPLTQRENTEGSRKVWPRRIIKKGAGGTKGDQGHVSGGEGKKGGAQTRAG